MDIINYWARLCESEDDSSRQEQETVAKKHTVVEPEPVDDGSEDQKPVDENGPVHYALVANIRNGLFKKDDQVFICHLGTTDKDGNVTVADSLSEDDADKLFWDGENTVEFCGYKPNEDNDWDYISNFSKCGKNEEILKRVKDHYGNRFRSFSIQEYYPNDMQDLFIDHIDPAMMTGLVPYCR